LSLLIFVIALKSSVKLRRKLKNWLDEAEQNPQEQSLKTQSDNTLTTNTTPTNNALHNATSNPQKEQDEKQNNGPTKENNSPIVYSKKKSKLAKITRKLMRKKSLKKQPEPTPEAKNDEQPKIELSEEEELELAIAAALAIHIELRLHQQPAVLTQLEFPSSVNTWALALRTQRAVHFDHLLTRNSKNYF